MNQFYRALHMPPKRLLRKVMGEKEIYTIAVRPRPTAEGTEPLPALEGGPYTLLPGREGWWFADPLLYHRRGKRWLFAEAMDLSTGKGRLEVCELHDDGTADDWRVALEEDFHLSFPMVFDWNGEVWMIPCGSTAARPSPPNGSWCSAFPRTRSYATRFCWTAAPRP